MYSFEGRARRSAINLSANGAGVVFTTTGNLTGENYDQNPEVFFFDVATEAITQVTKTTESNNFSPVINGDGSKIAFLSDADLTGENTDRNTEIFLFDASAKEFSQLTHTRRTEPFYEFSQFYSLSINADGTRIALDSSADLAGGNADGTVEIFLWDATRRDFTQVTNTASSETSSGNSFFPVINAEGTRIAFVSVGNFTGENYDGNGELFLFDTQTKAFTQVTHLETRFASLGPPVISADGAKIAFEGSANMLDGQNDGGIFGLRSEIFLFDATTNTLTQLTHSNGASSVSPAINADGNHIAFASSRVILVGADLYGYNPPRRRRSDPIAGTYLAICSRE